MNPSPRLAPPRRATLWLEPRSTSADGEIELACRLELPDAVSHRLWFRFAPAEQAGLTHLADPFVLAVLLHVMHRAETLHVHGPVSAGLLANLADFQQAYTAFHPAAHLVTLTADLVEEVSASAQPGGITAFSGGVDGAFSIYRHTTVSGLQPKRPLKAALLIHGYDVPLEQTDTFRRVAARCEVFAHDAGIALKTGSTNLRTFPIAWETVFGTAVAAALTFFSPGHAFALLPSAYNFQNTHLDHGSNPLMDPLLSSSGFAIIHDGAGYGRIDKLRHLARWPAALNYLRVCWQGGRDDNCCRCEKCVRTMLMLRLCGVDHSPAFPRDLTSGEIRRLAIPGQSGVNELTYLLQEAARLGLQADWTRALASAVARNRRYLALQAVARRAGNLLPQAVRTVGARATHRLFRRNGIQPAVTNSVTSAPSSALSPGQHHDCSRPAASH